MSSKTENIHQWTGRIFMLFFFFLVLSFLGNDNTPSMHTDSISFEQVMDMDDAVILNEPVQVSNYSSSLLSYQFLDTKITCLNFNKWISNNRAKHKQKKEEVLFYNLKPVLLEFKLLPLKTCTKKEHSLVS